MCVTSLMAFSDLARWHFLSAGPLGKSGLITMHLQINICIFYHEIAQVSQNLASAGVWQTRTFECPTRCPLFRKSLISHSLAQPGRASAVCIRMFPPLS